jgi:hypothetical protein
MLRDRSADADPGEPARDEADVIAWGDDGPPRRRRAFRLLDQVRADQRSTPLTVAALGLAAVFGSLVSDWATMRIREAAAEQSEPTEFIVGAANIDVGSGYLVGVLAIVALTALAVFGTPSVRHNARIAGAATSAGLLLLLVAGTVSLDGTVRRMYPFPSQVELEVDVRYDLGLTLAYAGTAALGLALQLAGRRGATRSSAPDDRDGNKPTEPGERRGPRHGWTETDEPVRDVTVLPAPPFTGPDWRQQYPR